MNFPFIHLRAHTEYSITESTLRINDMIQKAKDSGQPAIAMTDVDNMFGAIRFYTAARSAGIKAILGVDVQIQGQISQVDETEHVEPPHRVLLVCKNYQGYKKLMELISRAYTTNMIDGVSTLKEQWLEEDGTNGLICLSGDEKSLLGRTLLSDDPHKAIDIAKRYQQLFPEGYYIEVQRRGTQNEAQWIHKTVSLADSLNIPLVATHPMQFSERSDYIAHELKVCDKTKQILNDRSRDRKFTPEQFFYPTNYMQELFKDIPEAISNTVAIAKECNLEIPLGKNVLPPFPTPEGVSLKDFFIQQSNEGLAKRLIQLFPDPKIRAQKQPEYQKRLDIELQTIIKMGFDGYFMIVADFINWSKTNGIPVGPGRGSGAGSLVAYSLKITDLDPLRYNLLFERFLNPERVSMPDFDIDFCQLRRELVIKYVTDKYGSQAVAGICNITTLGAKNAVKATGRVLGIPLPAVDRISKLIPTKPGQEINLKDLINDKNSELRAAYDEQSQVKRVIDNAIRLEGLPHSIGQHAAGIVMAPGKISDFSPLYIPEGKLVAVTQYDKDDIEKAGLVKFDFLGLKTLTEIDYAVKTIKQDLEIKDFSLDTIPLDDQKTLEAFQQGDTVSVFQFESEGMQKLLKEAKPDRFEDLVALTSLYRPGPMDLIPDFIKRKHGLQQVNYIDPRIEPLLSETYGVMVYQEQVMQIAQVIGGYTLGGADLLRRAMGKKKPEEMAKHRQIFVQGAVKNSIPEDKAGKLYDDMEKFAGYGFNKSHAAAYSLLSFQTSYLKQHYPVAFYSSFLTVEGDEDTAEIPALIDDAKKHGITVLPPDINKSKTAFTPETLDDNTKSHTHIRYGFSALKGIGKEIAGKIEMERQHNGNFTDLLDFCKRMDKVTNKKTLEILIKSGAFDSLNPNRAQCLEYFPLITKYLDDYNKAQLKELKSKSDAALNVLKKVASKRKTTAKKVISAEELPMPPMPQTPMHDTLVKCLGEKMAFGFFFTDNPYHYYKQQLGGLGGTLELKDVSELYPSYQSYWIGGIITDIKTFNTAKGKMGIIKITDGELTQEVKAFSDVFEPMQKLVKPDQFVLFSAVPKEDKFSSTGVGLIASEIKDFNGIKMLLAETVNIALQPESDKIQTIKNITARHPGNIPIQLWIPNNNSYSKVENQIKLTCSATDQCMNEFIDEFSEKFAKLKLKKILPAPPVPVKRKYGK